MPFREIAGKVVAFAIVVVGLVAAGLLVLWGPHSADDTLNMVLAGVLLLLALATAGLGVVMIGAVIYDARVHLHEKDVHLTPRAGPPALPPPWGMGDVGRPGRPLTVGERPPGGGGKVRVMSVAVSNLDGPLFIGFLLLWTVAGLLLLAPR